MRRTRECDEALFPRNQSTSLSSSFGPADLSPTSLDRWRDMACDSHPTPALARNIACWIPEWVPHTQSRVIFPTRLDRYPTCQEYRPLVATHSRLLESDTPFVARCRGNREAARIKMAAVRPFPK